jgi:flagellar basal-body rod protein FlgC
MSLFHIFDVAGSALSAQSVRLNTVASNLANADSVSSSVGATYRARRPVFEAVLAELATGGPAAVGVRVAGIVESAAPLPREYRPEHPAADAEGYVLRSNVNVMEEMADMMAASRSYQNGVELISTSRQMLSRLLALGQ